MTTAQKSSDARNEILFTGFGSGPDRSRRDLELAEAPAASAYWTGPPTRRHYRPLWPLEAVAALAGTIALVVLVVLGLS